MAYIDQQAILDATNGGLDIIIYYYPQAQASFESSRKEFKIRNEKTASARLKQLADKNWVVTDFGGDQTPRNGVQICAFEENVQYREALAILAERYGVGAIKAETHKSEFEKRDATPEEKEGEYYFEVREEIPEHELKVLGPKVTQKVCSEYHVFSLISFTQIKNRKALITKSTDNYPIFLFDNGDWKKIYQPKNPEKQYRFRYYGNKPKDFVNGLAQLIKANEKYRNEQLKESDELDDNNSKKIDKYPEAILVSGDRDALNAASLRYKPLWLNSETAVLQKKEFITIIGNCETLYNLPDIDETGRRAAIKLGLTYLDIKIVWLPERLKTFRDHRGNPRKDLTDYVELYPHSRDLEKLLRVAVPMRFWDEEYKSNGIKYHFNNEHAYHFLRCNGFNILEDKNNKEDLFIRVDGNVVREVKSREAKVFIQKFLEQRHLPIPLRNMIYTTNQLNDASLTNLPEIKIDFTDYDKHSQYLFFKNKTWCVTANGIEEFKSGDITKYVWEEEVIDHKVKKTDSPFTISYDKEEDEYDIEIHNIESLFFRYLINSSRVHWRLELEERLETLEPKEQDKYLKENRFKIDGSLLKPEEIYEQKRHLINKIFSLGYLLHRYKDPARPWCVFAMDNNISESGKSFGRSGKSVCYKAPRHFMKSVTLPGRNPKLTDNPHIYDRVTEHTDYILIDDANEYIQFNFFFEPLTGELVVNPKNNKSYEIQFQDVPKFCITSNFALRNIDPSTEGRLLYTVFSDYYHIQTDDTDYKEERSIRDDIGKNLFLDYEEKEWNHDFNFFAQCLSFFISVPSPKKINPPMDNVLKRNLKTEMGAIFEDWADVFFTEEGDKVNEFVPREDAFNDFMSKTNQHKWTTNKFTKSLKAWCKYNKHILNPTAYRNSAGRIIRKTENKSVEMIYIQLNNHELEQTPEEVAKVLFDDKELTEAEKPM